VQRLLVHLHAVGFHGAPRALGRDERGREVLSYVEGWVPPDLDARTDSQLAAAAQLLREFHDATAGSSLADASEVVCHNDVSPCNFVFRGNLPVALIDFDAAAPGARVDDIAYGGWMWVLSMRAAELPLRQLGVFLDAYGPGLRSGVIDRIAAVQDHHRTLMEQRSAAQSAPRGGYARRAAVWMLDEQMWLRQHEAELAALLRR
jgi:Ser/Thr protein kinase RdoA (MazF antagonist)